jgi:hypothetical protein
MGDHCDGFREFPPVTRLGWLFEAGKERASYEARGNPGGARHRSV